MNGICDDCREEEKKQEENREMVLRMMHSPTRQMTLEDFINNKGGAMEVKLKKIILENYRCFPHKEVDFYQRTKISGRNKQGKSTIMSAYLEVMTGKEANGTQPDGIRPHDENGADIDKVDIIRELHLEIDGKPTVIRKITKQKWRKPKGKSEEVFDGNSTEYEVDGFPMSGTKFAEFIGRIAPADMLLMCSNAQPFLEKMKKSTTEARKTLESISGFSIENFITENGYQEVAELTKGHSVEDTMKKLRKQLSDQKKKVDAKNTEIKYEKTRSTELVDISALELAKGEWREKLAAVDVEEQQLEQAVKAFDELHVEIADLQSKRFLVLKEERKKLEAQHAEVSSKISPLKTKKADLEYSLKDTEANLYRAERMIENLTANLNQAREDYKKYSAREFDETKLHEIEVEEMSPDSLICPTCGQAFTESQAAKIRTDFEESKKRRVADEMRLKETFIEARERKLDEITESGNEAKEALAVAKGDKEVLERKNAELKDEIQLVSAEIEKLTAELDKLPKEVDLSENEEYQSLSKQIENKQTQLSSLDNGAEKRSEFRQRRNEYNTELNKIEAQILKAQADTEEKEERLSKLETELLELSQTAASLEGQIDLISEFSRRKNEALAAAINPYFNHFHFEFLEYTQEGNPVETLKIMCGGTDYFDGLNHSDQILCNISLVCGLQKLNGLNIPVFVDDFESVNSERLPQIEQQMVVLEVSKDGLKVEEMA